MIERVCKQCGRKFTIAESEVEFYNNNNLELPKRCGSCRKKNKRNRASESSANISTKSNVEENKVKDIIVNSNKKKRGLFGTVAIATLVVILLFIGKVFNITPILENIEGLFQNEQSNKSHTFRSDDLWEEHFLKHKDEFAYTTKEEYLDGANEVISSYDSKYKEEGSDGDKIYYNEEKNEIVFISVDGYIRTYFKPDGGINYFNKQ